jgi:hypothetical protein
MGQLILKKERYLLVFRAAEHEPDEFFDFTLGGRLEELLNLRRASEGDRRRVSRGTGTDRAAEEVAARAMEGLPFVFVRSATVQQRERQRGVFHDGCGLESKYPPRLLLPRTTHRADPRPNGGKPEAGGHEGGKEQDSGDADYNVGLTKFHGVSITDC